LTAIFKAEVSHDPPIANSSIVTFPIELIAALFKLFIIVQLYGGTKSSSIFDDHVVNIPFSQYKSFIEIGAQNKDHSSLFNQFLFT